MSKVRINDLARELELKSKAILDVLTDVGVTEKKTHSSSLELDEAERVRTHFNRGGKAGGASTAARAEAEAKPKIDWSRVSKPGDVLKAIQQRKEEEALAASRPAPQPPAAKPAAAVAPVAPPVAANVAPRQPVPQAPPAAPVEAARPAPRKIVPQPRQASAVIALPPQQQTPAIAAKPPAGPVVAKPPVGPPVEARPAIAAAPPVVPVSVKPTTPPPVAAAQVNTPPASPAPVSA